MLDDKTISKSDEIECKSEDEIREYLSNKSIVVFASDSFVDEDNDYGQNQNEVVSFMVPIAEKRLDFRQHKHVIVQVEE